MVHVTSVSEPKDLRMGASGADTVIMVQRVAWVDVQPERCILRFTMAIDCTGCTGCTGGTGCTGCTGCTGGTGGSERAPVVERVTAALMARPY